MVRQQEKGPHRRIDDMRREEDRRMAEREQVTNCRGHGICKQPITMKLRRVFQQYGTSCSGGEIPSVGCHSSKGLN